MKKRTLSIIVMCIVAISMLTGISAFAGENEMQEGVQSDGTAIWNGHRYEIFYKAKSWEEAQQHCESMGGHLLTITSPKEQDFIVGYLKSQDAQGKFMLGLYANDGQIATEKKWCSSEPLKYTNWGSGQPSGNQSTAVLVTYDLSGDNWHVAPYQWDDDADGCYAYICEWDIKAGANSEPIAEDADILSTITSTLTVDDAEDAYNDIPQDIENFDMWLFPELYEGLDEPSAKTDEPAVGDDILAEDIEDLDALLQKLQEISALQQANEERSDISQVWDTIHEADAKAYIETYTDKNGKVKPIADNEQSPCLFTKPLTLYAESGIAYDQYSASNYNKDVAPLPLDISTVIKGNEITITLPEIAGYHYKDIWSDDPDAEPSAEYNNFRDEIVLHGTIDEAGSSYEGEGDDSMYGTVQGRRLYYWAGTIDSTESFVDNVLIADCVETSGYDEETITNLSEIGSYQRDGETEKFSKFFLYYYPDDDFFELGISLYGDYTIIDNSVETDYDNTLEWGGDFPYMIAATSSYEDFRAGKHVYDWMEWK